MTNQEYKNLNNAFCSTELNHSRQTFYQTIKDGRKILKGLWVYHYHWGHRDQYEVHIPNSPFGHWAEYFTAYNNADAKVKAIQALAVQITAGVDGCIK